MFNKKELVGDEYTMSCPVMGVDSGQGFKQICFSLSVFQR